MVDWPKNEKGYEIRKPFTEPGLSLKERFHAIIDEDPAVVADKIDHNGELNNLRKLALETAATLKVLPEAFNNAARQTTADVQHIGKVLHPTIDSQPHKRTREDVLNELIFNPQSDAAALDLVPGMGVTASAAAEGLSLGVKQATAIKRGWDFGSDIAVKGLEHSDDFDDIVRATELAFDMEQHNIRAVAEKGAAAAKEATRRLHNPTRIEHLKDATSEAVQRLYDSGKAGKVAVRTAWQARHPIRAGQSLVSRRLVANGEAMMEEGLEVILGNDKLKKQMLDALTPAQRLASKSYGEAFNALRTTKPKALGRILGNKWYSRYMNIEKHLGRVNQGPSIVYKEAERRLKRGARFLERGGASVAPRISGALADPEE